MRDLNPYLPASLILIVGLFVSFSLYKYILEKENFATEENFKRAAIERINTIETRLKNKLTILRSVVAFYAGSKYVSYEEFNSFINTVSDKGEAIQALEWIPAITARKRTDYINILKNNGYPSFEIIEKNKNGEKVIAKYREIYYPVYYVVPYIGNEGAHGFDLGSNAIRLEALNKARDTGDAVASGLIKLVQLKEKNEGVLVFHPVYSKKLINNTLEERRKHIQGFILAVFRLTNLISGAPDSSSSLKNKAAGIDIYLFDASNLNKAKLLYVHNSRSRKGDIAPIITLDKPISGAHVKYTFLIGGRTWVLVLKPLTDISSNSFGFFGIVILTLSILMTLLTTFYFISTTKRTRLIEEEVKQRTLDLKDAVEIANNREKSIRSIVDNTGEGIISINEEGYIATVNPAFEKIFGYSKKEVLGKNVNIFLPDDVTLKEGQTFGELDFKKLHGSSQTIEIDRKHKNGKIISIELTLSSVVISGKKMFIGIIHDISARKETENLKDGFISTVSHELRTPMTSIKGSLSILLSGAVGTIPDTAKNMIEIAYKNSERLIRLINDILDIEKMSSGKMNYKMQDTNLSELLRQSIEENSGYAKKYNVNYKLISVIKDAKVNADYDRLMQVTTNLLSNAAKFSNEGEDILINLEVNDDMYCVSVIDGGEGIPDQFRTEIFKRFSQADSSDTKQKYGTGLGLAICKSIISEHKGRIDYESSRENGTRFYFSIPKI